MEIKPPAHQLQPLLTLTKAAATPPTWRPGQVLKAAVLSAVADGKVALRIGDTQVQAQLQAQTQGQGRLQLTPGQTLQLKVESLAHPVVLKLLAPAAATPNPAAAALRGALPRQTGMAPLMANLGAAAAPATGPKGGPPLPAPAAELARTAFTRIAGAATVTTPDGLRQAVKDSGVFLEAKLARGAAPAAQGGSPDINGDLKAALLRLRDALQPGPGRPAIPPSGDKAPPQGQLPARPGQGIQPPPTGTPPDRPAAPGLPQRPGQPTVGETRPGVTPVPPRGAPPAPPQGAATPSGSTSPSPAPPGTATAAGATLAADILPPPIRGAIPHPQPAAQPTLMSVGSELQARAELLRQVEGALARIQLSQLASLPDEGQGEQRPQWLVELPVRREDATDLFQLRIEREGADNARDEAERQGYWSVRLAFDLPGLGPVHTRVTLAGERVSTVFWAEEPGSAGRLQRNLDQLRNRLSGAGLEVGRLSCHAGAPADTRTEPPPPGLVEEKA